MQTVSNAVLQAALHRLDTLILPKPIHFAVPWPPVTANKVWVPYANRGRLGVRLCSRARGYFKAMGAHLLTQGITAKRLAIDLDVRLELLPPRGEVWVTVRARDAAARTLPMATTT